jgi:putative holliday junction resolvase
MAEVSLTKIAKSRKPASRLMCLDLGSKTIGLALSDVSLMIASPLGTIKRTKFTHDAKTLEALIDEHNVGGLIIGLPINMDGSEGPRCQSTRQFSINLLERRDIPLAFWDERLSTVAIERVLIEEIDMTRKRRAKIIDKVAATYILQGALDALQPLF